MGSNQKREGRMNPRRRVKAQAVSEYSLFLAIVLIAVIAINVYVKRGLQGRYADVVDTTTNFVSVRAAQTLPGLVGYSAGYVQDVLRKGLPRQYEPGYVDSQQIVDAPRSATETIESQTKIKTTLSPGTINVSDIDVEKTDAQ